MFDVGDASAKDRIGYRFKAFDAARALADTNPNEVCDLIYAYSIIDPASIRD